MEKYKVIEMDDSSVVFSSLYDMEEAYLQLADGKDIILFKENENQRTGEILSGKIFSIIIEGKFKLSIIENI